jgi:Tfp pilus assembly protein FimT
MTYTFDFDGDPGLTDSYIGMRLLGTSPQHQVVNYNSWQFHNTSDPVYFAPKDDPDRYNKMANPLFSSQIALLRLSGRNELTLISTGSFSHLNPGDSINVVFAIICAKKSGTQPASLDKDEQRRNLYVGANWAQRAYNGEDRNGNGIQDSNEVWTNHGQPRRYFLPAPPNPPRVKVVPANHGVSIYWDASSEQSVDPISNLKDFEGYRIYGTNAGADLTQAQNLLGSLVVVGEFDRADDNISYNTGFGRVRLTQPVTFPDDTTRYWYCFSISNLLNGWQYAYTVTAFDKGDPSINLQSLESSQIQNLARIVPGTPPNSDKSVSVGVYPNPYYAHAYWDGATERERKLYFFNLPGNSVVRIYTLAGDIVDEFEHHAASYNASDIKWFSTYSDGSQILAGGEHAWDLVTSHDQAVATGLYLFTVKDLDTGDIKRGKFLVIK